jgi:putative endonuclease
MIEMAAYIYIMTNKTNAVLYTGVTSNLIKRVYEHKEGMSEGFTLKYNVKKLIYYEIFHDIINAIEREKQIKSWKRIKKERLINSINPNWQDLYEKLI